TASFEEVLFFISVGFDTEGRPNSCVLARRRSIRTALTTLSPSCAGTTAVTPTLGSSGISKPVRSVKTVRTELYSPSHQFHGSCHSPVDYTFSFTRCDSKHRLPAIYTAKELVEEGGLMSYGIDF